MGPYYVRSLITRSSKTPVPRLASGEVYHAMLELALPLLVVFVPLLNFLLMVTFSNYTRS